MNAPGRANGTNRMDGTQRILPLDTLQGWQTQGKQTEVGASSFTAWVSYVWPEP